MNPYSRFIDAGHRFQCSLCHHISEVNQTYYYNLDHTGYFGNFLFNIL